MRLKCGDIFYLKHFLWLSSKPCNIDSYGIGDKPIITHFMILPNVVDSFTLEDDNIWSASLGWYSFSNNDLIDFDCTAEGVDNYNIAFIYSPVQDKIVFGRRVNYMSYQTMPTSHKSYYEDPAHPERNQSGYAYSWLQRDGDFYVNRDAGYLSIYFYSTSDPNTFGPLWFCSKCHAFNVPSNCYIRNIKIMGFGNHGIQGAMRNVLIENVDIDLVGGIVPGSDTSHQHDSLAFTREGNGIEFWIPSDLTYMPCNNIVRNCHISRTFDCACTIQGFPTEEDPDTIVASDILFEHNIIRNCRQAFECFANRMTSEGNIAYPFSNCRFSNNICIGSGISEFRTAQEQDAHIDWGARDMVVKDNVFIEGNYHFYARNQPNVFDGNICYIREGQLLVSHVWHWQGWTPICYPVKSDSSTWISGSSSYSQAVTNAISAYQLITGDTTTIFYRITD